MLDIKVGDMVDRFIGESVAMKLQVTEVTPELIFCGDWTFDRETGGEVDEYLGWTKFASGSFIKLRQPREPVP